jgi:hypothetical protein
VELLLKRSGIVPGGIAFGGGDSELFLGLLQFQIGGGGTGGDGSGSGRNGQGRRLEDNIGEGFGVSERFPHLLVGGVGVSEGREMPDGVGREEAAEFGELGGVGHCGIREGGVEGRSGRKSGVGGRVGRDFYYAT